MFSSNTATTLPHKYCPTCSSSSVSDVVTCEIFYTIAGLPSSYALQFFSNGVQRRLFFILHASMANRRISDGANDLPLLDSTETATFET